MTANTRHTMQLTTPSDHEITLTRAFNAPSALVFEALTKPEHIRRWWGAERVDLTVCEFDARPGGQWRFAGRAADGNEIAFFGEVREIDPPKKLVFTEAFDVPVIRDRPSIVTSILTERDGVTTLTVTSLFQSTEDRDMVIATGMETGAAESYDRLEDLVATLTPAT
jgi:uncharacterized protein YndB with AHSA1/START domain